MFVPVTALLDASKMRCSMVLGPWGPFNGDSITTISCEGDNCEKFDIFLRRIEAAASKI